MELRGVTYRCRHLVCAIGHLFTILFIKGREAVKVIYKADVVALHSNACRNQYAPCDGLWIKFDALKQAHFLLLVRG